MGSCLPSPQGMSNSCKHPLMKLTPCPHLIRKMLQRGKWNFQVVGYGPTVSLVSHCGQLLTYVFQPITGGGGLHPSDIQSRLWTRPAVLAGRTPLHAVSDVILLRFLSPLLINFEPLRAVLLSRLESSGGFLDRKWKVLDKE